MSVIRWEDPPPDNRGRPGQETNIVAHELIAHQLRKRPGEWAVIVETTVAQALAGDIKKGKYRAYKPAGSFDAVSRSIGGTFRVYARYVGTGER